MSQSFKIVQVCREFESSGGVSGVARNLEEQFRARGLEVERVSVHSFRSLVFLRSLIPEGWRRMRHLIDVIGFTLLGTLRIHALRSDSRCVVIVHNDALGGDLYVNHGLHKALVWEAGIGILLRNPIHAFLLVREEARHRRKMYKRVVCLSASEVERLLKYYPSVEPELVRTIPNGVDERLLRIAQQSSQPALTRKNLRVLFVGHEFRRKGLAQIIDAIALARVDVRLTVVGGLPRDVEAWSRRFAKLGDSKVSFVGAVANVEDYFSSVDLLALASDFESFALVGVEAMAFGVPCVFSRGASAGNYLVPGSNGFITDSAQEMADAFDLWFDMAPDGKATMAENARSTAREHSWSASASRYIDALCEI